MLKRGIGAALAVGVALAAWPSAAAGGQAEAGPPTRELFDRYCVTCHNPRLLTGGLDLGAVDPDADRGPCLRPGEGRPQAAHGSDAAGGAAAPGPGRDRHVRDPPRARPRRGGGGRPEPGPGGVAAAEPRRVRQRHRGPAGPRGQRRGAAAVGHGRVRLRQQRRGAVDHAGADVPLHRGRDQDQPGRGRQPRHPPRHAALRGGLRAA